MLGDVNISAILDSFSVSYDKRVRPNYGGEYGIVNTSRCLYAIHTIRVRGRPHSRRVQLGSQVPGRGRGHLDPPARHHTRAPYVGCYDDDINCDGGE